MRIKGYFIIEKKTIFNWIYASRFIPILIVTVTRVAKNNKSISLTVERQFLK